TNGTLIGKKEAEQLKKIKPDYVQVSLDGMQKANDFLRGEGSFSKAVQGMDFLAKEGIPFIVSMTVNRANWRDVPEMVKFCDSIGAKALGVRRFVPAGRGLQIKEKMLDPLETKKLYEFVFTESQKRGKGQMAIFLGCEDGILSQNPHYMAVGCSAGFGSLTVLPNGNIYPCRKLPILAGNVLKKSLLEIFNNSMELKKLRSHQNASEICKKCFFFQECKGGAKCLSFGYFGTPFAPDPQCWRLFERLPEKKEKIKSRIKDFLAVYKSQEHYEVLGHISAFSKKDAIKKARKELALEAEKYEVKKAVFLEIGECSTINFKKSELGHRH
ncbi:MAG: radical SAM protein, partial [Candidatus Diapherotrites archaeon]